MFTTNLTTAIYRLGFLTALSLCITSCIDEKDDAEGIDLKIGDKIPAFCVMTNKGTVIRTSDLIGSVTVLTFFHTGCPDCRQELPRLQHVADVLNDSPVQFLCISREEEASSIEAFWNANGLNLPYSAQPERTLYNLFATSGIPRTFISDAQGIIRYIFTDKPLANETELLQAIRSLYSQPDPSNDFKEKL